MVCQNKIKSESITLIFRCISIGHFALVSSLKKHKQVSNRHPVLMPVLKFFLHVVGFGHSIQAFQQKFRVMETSLKEPNDICL
jgi:hypothetical protein